MSFPFPMEYLSNVGSADDMLGGLDLVGPQCVGCGCTDGNACATENGACFWVEDNLCSACAFGTAAES